MKLLTGTMIGAMMLCSATMIADDVVENLLKTPAAVEKWGNGKAMEFLPTGGPEGEPAVKITNAANPEGVMCSMTLPVDKIKGKTIKVSADIKAENVSKPKAPYLGVKMMLIVKTADGKTQFVEHKNKKIGTHDWEEFANVLAIPADATSVVLQIGLQNSTGTIYFSDLDVEYED